MKGSCLCGHVVFGFKPMPGLLGNCHCRVCRKSHGAPFVTWLIVDPTSLQIEKGEDCITEHNHTPGVGRVFCKKCGSRLWDYEKSSHGTAKKSGMFTIAAAAVDSEIPYPVACHFNVESKAPWVSITDELPQFAGWPDQGLMMELVLKYSVAGGIELAGALAKKRIKLPVPLQIDVVKCCA